MKLQDFETDKIVIMGDKDIRINSETRVKFGIDPTAPDLHLGHMVALRQLKRMQDAGANIILVVGDFTAKIGDPTGRDTTRPMLTANDIDANVRTYINQISKILNVNKNFHTVYNSRYSGDMHMNEFIQISSHITLSKMLEHSTFRQRMQSSESIRIHELLYPIAQAKDSIMMQCQIEVGGSDQTFNFAITRDIQRSMSVPRQSCLILPILVGIDGRNKMSKSLNNYIGLNEDPNVIRDKLSKMPDENVQSYMELLTDLYFEGFRDILDAKKQLIYEVLAQTHSRKVAIETMDNYGRKKKTV